MPAHVLQHHRAAGSGGRHLARRRAHHFYLRDIDRDYREFNEERTAFYKEQGLDPLPASTGIQAKLCRPELLVEGEAIAIFKSGAGSQPAAAS
jgi:enamine deaminase RidA (YjgF/YER057c/UK114 family)